MRHICVYTCLVDLSAVVVHLMDSILMHGRDFYLPTKLGRSTSLPSLDNKAWITARSHKASLGRPCCSLSFVPLIALPNISTSTATPSGELWNCCSFIPLPSAGVV